LHTTIVGKVGGAEGFNIVGMRPEEEKEGAGAATSILFPVTG
jgi:hypothetical protein